MRLDIIVPAFALLASIPVSGQTTATPQLQTLQTRVVTAILGSVKPTTIKMQGTFTSTEGSLTQSGAVQLTLGADGSSTITLSRSRGSIAETRTVASGLPSCTWTDQAGTKHSSPMLNCLPPPWFFPAFALFAAQQDALLPSWLLSSTSDDSAGQYLVYGLAFPGSTDGLPVTPPLSLLVDPDSHLPVSISLYLHPEKASHAANVLERVKYAGYRNIDGVMLPFHIQRYLNNALVLDLSISSATVQ